MSNQLLNLVNKEIQLNVPIFKLLMSVYDVYLTLKCYEYWFRKFTDQMLISTTILILLLNILSNLAFFPPTDFHSFHK